MTVAAYGIKALQKNDPHILNAEKASHGLTQAQVPGLFLVESIPMLKYVPEWLRGFAMVSVLDVPWKQASIAYIKGPSIVFFDIREVLTMLPPAAQRLMDGSGD